MGLFCRVGLEGCPIEKLIEVNQVTYSYVSPAAPVIKNLSLQISRGQFVSIVGPSGCGKSTLFKLAAGLLEPESGTILLNGRDGSRLGRVAYMPQQDLLLPWKTVLANCMLPVMVQRGDRKRARETALRMLERFGLGERASAYPDELSGGMRQRAALLRTLMHGGELLLLDEPFGALDAMTKREMHGWLLPLLGELNLTVLFITHDLEEAVLLSDRVLVMPASPGKPVKELHIDLPKPRTAAAVFTSRSQELRAELEGMLYAQE